MVYDVTIEKDLEDKLCKLKNSNFREYTILNREIKQMREYAKIPLNHRTQFNSFDKPLQKYKWIPILNHKILVFTIDPMSENIHLCDYLRENEVFN